MIRKEDLQASDSDIDATEMIKLQKEINNVRIRL
jgi:hypothetical protein